MVRDSKERSAMKHYRRKNFFDEWNEQLDLGVTAEMFVMMLLVGLIITITILDILTN
jgi:hypothetical protein